MAIFLQSILFELNLRKKRISTYVYFLLFLCFALVITLTLGGAFKGAVVSLGFSNKTLANAPVVLNSLILILSLYGLFIMAPFFGQAICKDYEAQMDSIIFSTSVNRKSLLLGRFCGVFLILTFIFSGMAVGIWIATLLPLMQPHLVAPMN